MKVYNNCYLLGQPKEILAHILDFLPASDLGRCAQVCKQLNDLSESDNLWEKFMKVHDKSKYDYMKAQEAEMQRVDQESSSSSLTWLISFGMGQKFFQMFGLDQKTDMNSMLPRSFISSWKRHYVENALLDISTLRRQRRRENWVKNRMWTVKFEVYFGIFAALIGWWLTIASLKLDNLLSPLLSLLFQTKDPSSILFNNTFQWCLAWLPVWLLTSLVFGWNTIIQRMEDYECYKLIQHVKRRGAYIWMPLLSLNLLGLKQITGFSFISFATVLVPAMVNTAMIIAPYQLFRSWLVCGIFLFTTFVLPWQHSLLIFQISFYLSAYGLFCPSTFDNEIHRWFFGCYLTLLSCKMDGGVESLSYWTIYIPLILSHIFEIRYWARASHIETLPRHRKDSRRFLIFSIAQWITQIPIELMFHWFLNTGVLFWYNSYLLNALALAIYCCWMFVFQHQLYVSLISQLK